jgi:hypothetical protein
VAPAPSTTDQKDETKGADSDKKPNPEPSPAAPGDRKAEADKQSTPPTAETKQPDSKDPLKAPTPPRSEGSNQPSRQGQPGGTPPRRAAGGAMAIQAPPQVEAAARTPLEPRESLDKYLTDRVYRYLVPKEPVERTGLPLSAQSAKLVRWPDDARGFFYLGVFYIKDGYSLSEEKNFPGLLDGYEFIMNNDWMPYQDFLIGGILLIISILLWFMQGAASRRLKAGVLEIVPA